MWTRPIISVMISLLISLIPRSKAHIMEEHKVSKINSEEVHSWIFTDEEHLLSSKLWRALEETDVEFNKTTIHLNETNQMFVLSSTNPLTFYEFEAGDPNTFSNTVPVTGCLRMVNNTSSITYIDAQGYSLSTPPGLSVGVSLLLVSLANDYGFDGLGTKLYMSNTVICRAGVGETIQIQKKLKFTSFPKARLKKLIWKKRKAKSIIEKVKDVFKKKEPDVDMKAASLGGWTEGKWEDIYTLYKYKKLGLLFFNLNELKHEKPFCESRRDHLQCSVLSR
ncbi:hypothetical protein CORT_0A05140 [Candida orthopsilosis Co 90-125]|uniref:Uncharacterized protein n=1 Tax=Candida orthopsilosis (strain 90-125) TaxID=1136231 RepID=H8WXV5_CANO9|nr:hypothetical protein CORT_0A05140 [Candida orthopsilosis Co 90-125]CCG20902.1 hypothetical protein CORT_0A05140 [Candida orthopsilosis Co 90-125]